MKRYRKILIIIPLLLSVFMVAAQVEDCSNGLDDDGDGFIDCYDGDCSGNAKCLSFYFGNSVVCKDPATQSPAFATGLQWASADRTAFNSVTPAIGDLDGDGIPEVVSTNRVDNTVTILDGATGVTKFGPLDVKFDIAKTVAIANIDGDDCGEIFVRGFRNKNIRMYDCQLNEIWDQNTNTGGKVGIISLADFNGDGIVELLHGNEIRNAHTGEVIIAGTGNFETEVTHATIAIDVLPNSAGLEIVDGGKIYTVDIPKQTKKTASNTGTRTLAKDVNDFIADPNSKYEIKYNNWNFNSSAVADYNQDGDIDVIFNGGQYVNGTLTTTVFFWDVSNGNVKTFNVPKNHVHATGRINVADIDGDGMPNCTFVSKQKLYALDENMNQLWSKDIKEGSSGFTGCTVFDFNDDKAAEIIYRGENYIHIIDGKTGISSKQIKCTSRTYEEYPIVADVDGDGASEICVSCSTDDNTPFDPYDNGRYGQIRVFEASGGESWQPSRPIWNQHSYFNVNINDDLTIPIVQQNPTKVFSSNACTTGQNRPLNAFLNQAPYLDGNGCPSLVSPDIELVNVKNIGDAQCPEVKFDVTTVIRNAGDIALTGLLPITFYNGPPSDAKSIKLNTFVTTVSNFDVGNTMNITGEVLGKGGDFDLYVSVNDDGSQNPPITSFSRPIPECDNTNNITFKGVTALDFDLRHDVLSDNEICDPQLPSNGDAEVYYFGTISQTVDELWKEDFENLSNGDTDDTGSTAWSFTHKPADANPDRIEVSFTGATNEVIFDDTDGEVRWESEQVDISAYQLADISIDLRSSATTDSNNDYLQVYYSVDGGVEQSLTDGLHVGNFGRITATAKDIKGSSLTIIVRAQNDKEDEFYYIDNVLISGITNAQSGKITAGFNFYWFQNNLFTDTLFVGSRIATLDNGVYQVVATSQTNSCKSEVEEITINKVQVLPDVIIEKTQDLTRCDNPDGILTAYVLEDDGSGGTVKVVKDYDFKWYLGNDFTVVQSVGNVAKNLQAETYSVVATSNTTGCETILSETVDTKVARPELEEISIKNIKDCANPDSGTIEVNVINETNSDFTFQWYKGSVIKAVPDDDISGEIISGVEKGFHTVRAVSNITGCVSDPITLFVDDLSNAPKIVITTTENASCTNDGSGTASAAVTGESISDYSFVYYNGSSTTANVISTTSGTSNEVAQLLTAGQYLVTAEHNVTGCLGRAYFTITDSIVNPTLPSGLTVDVYNETTCGGVGQADGTIDLSGIALANVAGTKNFEAIENGSFEVPIIPGDISIFDQVKANGWSTDNPSGNLEYWKDGYDGVPSVDGNQFAELNSDGVGAFYFDVVTKPGIRMVYSFSHRGRAGDDTMSLEIDDPSATNPIEIRRETTGNKAWVEYTGDYIVPAGQTLTRFAFRAISTAASISVGNFLDNVVFEIAPYYYQLHSGSNSSGTPIDQNTSGVFDNLPNGQYTISIVNNITGCPSDDITVNVLSADSEPIIARQSKTSDNYCVDGNGTQRITATSGTLVGGEPKAGYEFTIFTGTNITASPYQPSVIDADGDYTFVDLEGGNYTVLVTNLDENCSNTTDFTILDDIQGPSFASPIVSDQSNCTGSPNGMATVNIFGSLPKEDYTWSWLDNNGNPIAGKTDVDGSVDGTANNIKDYKAGTYQVNAVNTKSGCETGFTDVVIDFVKAFPVINLNELAINTGCNVGNGSLGATVDDGSGLQVTSEYTFEWFVGIDDSGTVLTDSDNAGNGSDVLLVADSDSVFSIISGLNAPSGNATYTVRVTHTGDPKDANDNGTGCSNLSTITLGSKPTVPVIDTNDPTDVVITEVMQCSASANYADGEIELLDVTDTGVSDPEKDFTYNWYIGKSNTGTLIVDGVDIGTQRGGAAAAVLVADATTNHIKNLDAGIYSVEAVNKATGCISVSERVEITENIVTINIDANVTQDDFNCDSKDPIGQITANNPNVVDNLGHTIEWFQGTNTIAANLLPAAVKGATATQDAQGNDHIIDKLPSGTYTVKVTNNKTNCFETEEVTIRRATPLFSFSTGSTAQVNCTPLDGSANVNNLVVSFSDGGSTPIGYVENITYTWYDGENKSSPVLAETSELLDKKAAAFYSVVINETASGCTSNLTTIKVRDNTPTPATVDISTGTNAGGQTGSIPTSCSGDYGGIVADITANTAGNNISFEWYEGAADYVNNPGTPLSTGDDLKSDANASIQVFTNSGKGTAGNAALLDIPAGLYSLVMIDGVSNCRTQEVYDLAFIGQQATTTLAIKHVENCPDNGEATVGLADNITATYPKGSGGFVDGEQVSSVSATGILGSDDGTKIIVTTTSGTPFKDGETITGSVSGATAVNPTITSGFVDGEVDDISEYDIYLYAGNGVPADKITPYEYPVGSGDMYPVVLSGAGVTAGASVTFGNLPEGDYTAVARQINNPSFAPGNSDRCFSASATDLIEQRGFEPILDSHSITSNTNCDLSALGGNGSITATASKFSSDIIQNNDFEFRWYIAGSETFGKDEILIDTDVVTSTLSSLVPGDYVLNIYRLGLPGPNSNGCEITESFTVPDDPKQQILTIKNSDISHIVDCNGTASITIDDSRVTSGKASDYTFTWHKDTYGNVITGKTKPTLSGQTAGTYYVEAELKSTGCITSAVEFEMLENTSDPDIVFSSITNDSYCGDELTVGGDGSITANVVGEPAADYTFEWFYGSGKGTALGASGIVTQGTSGTNGQTATGLPNGTYIVKITDNTSPNSTCSSEASLEILNVPQTHEITNVSLTHVVDCGGTNGTATITNADVTSSNTKDYDFTWYSSSPLTSMGGTTASIGSLSPGTYFVEAIDKISGCSTNRVKFEILDNSVAPMVTVTLNTLDSSCDPTINQGNGELDWMVDNDDGGTYSYQWYTGSIVKPRNALTDVGSITNSNGTGNSGTLSGISEGTYTIRLTDTQTTGLDCFVDVSFKLDAFSSNVTIETALNTANTNCINENGEFQITELNEDGNVTSVLTNYTFTFNTTDSSKYVGNNVANGHIDQLTVGEYEVIITNNLTACDFGPFDFKINDQSFEPSILFTLNQADKFCTGGNGVLEVTTNASSPSYLWDNGATSATISNLDSGPYGVTITDGITGCTVKDTFLVPFDEDPIMIDVDNDVILTPTTQCGALSNGSIEITDITPNKVADYTYFLHTGSYTAGSGVNMGSTGVFGNLTGTTYYIEALNNITGCTSDVFEFILDDQSVDPVVDLINFELQTNCDPNNLNGLLTVGVDEGNGVISTSMADYTFDWSASGGPVNDTTYSALAAGFYDITVTDLTTGCHTDETYGMADDPNFPLLLNLSTVGNENCIGPNGEIAMSVINSVNKNADFAYYLYNGDVVPSPLGDANNEIASGFVGSLDVGFYTVLVVDKDSKCASDPQLVEIDDDNNTSSMEMLLTEDHALTKCIVNNNILADGQATAASVPEDPSRYIYYWYDGPSIANDVLIDSTLTVYQLVDKTYAVQMVDRITGCTIEDNITISKETEPVPLPEVTLVNNLTNCLIPNGALSAALNDSIVGVGYTFEWVDSDNNVISTTSLVSGLDVGTYGVVTRDIASGCTSAKADSVILDDRQEPFFTVSVTESICDELAVDGSYAGNGTAGVIFANPVITDEVFWTVDGGVEIDTTDISSFISNNERLSGLTPGNYRVLVVDENSCSYEETFQIDADVKVFNGLSDNGDNKNDYFKISCAGDFPNNDVKIFNRAGTLVYETKGYEDNVSGNVFSGNGNIGIGENSNSLPEGTYFYIFDKGEEANTRVYQGYLELVR